MPARRYETRASVVKWDDLKSKVATSIDLLKICWEGTEKGDADMHALMVRDLYAPMLEQLAGFIASVEVQQ